MSYCRWSSDNWKCDLYCYEDVSGGYTTHVAARKIVGEVPEASTALLLIGKTNEYFKAHRKQMDWLEKAKRVPIGLPYDGERFNDPDLASFYDRLIHLREVGYNFPNYVIETVKEEMLGVR